MSEAPASTAPSDTPSSEVAVTAPVGEATAFDDTGNMDQLSEAERAKTVVDIMVPDHGNPEEERTHTRVHIEVDVTARSDDTFWVGVTENISEGGLFVATSCPWPEDTVCELSVALDDGGPQVHVEGLVTWIREDRGDGLTPGMGLSFIDLDPKTRVRIQNYVHAHISRTVLWE